MPLQSPCGQSYLTMVLRSVDLASLWKVMMTLVAGSLSADLRYSLPLFLQLALRVSGTSRLEGSLSLA